MCCLACIPVLSDVQQYLESSATAWTSLQYSSVRSSTVQRQLYVAESAHSIPLTIDVYGISCPRILKFRAKNVLVVSYRQPILYFESFEELAGSRDWWFSLKDVPQVNSYSHASRQPRGVVKHKQVFLESVACVRSFRSLAVVCHQNKLKETGREVSAC